MGKGQFGILVVCGSLSCVCLCICVCWGCNRSHRQAGSHSNSQLKGVIESGGGEERDAPREHPSPLSLTLCSSDSGCGDLYLLVSLPRFCQLLLVFCYLFLMFSLSTAAGLCFYLLLFHHCPFTSLFSSLISSSLFLTPAPLSFYQYAP